MDQAGSRSLVRNRRNGRKFSWLIFTDAFKTRIQEHGKPSPTFSPEDFFAAKLATANPRATPDADNMSRVPPRLVSDQMINIFLQEWSPLFPVLHRPTFLKLYEDYVANPEGLNDCHAIAQLNLVFAIAALSAEVCIPTSFPRAISHEPC